MPRPNAEIVMTVTDSRGPLTYRRVALSVDVADFREPVVPDNVIGAVWDAFPRSWECVLKTMRWSNFDQCWYADIGGMLVGIERDGYVHS